MARVRLCVCGSWFVGREGQAAHPRAPGQCLHFECRGAPARVRVWRCEGRPPLPHHFVCVEKFTLPYLPYSFVFKQDPGVTSPIRGANLEMCTLDGCAPCFTAIRAKDGWHA